MNAAALPPSTERVRRARAVRDAFAANPHAGGLSLDGRTVEFHLRPAERILAGSA